MVFLFPKNETIILFPHFFLDYFALLTHFKRLFSNPTHIGVGYAKGGSYRTYWTQVFITK
ncbi:hypothetical protein F0342_21930 [Bacillus sp. CH30_1T]|nr:hypothetical protein F0342_21930 [Bacillus sp. CH30_1T]